MSVKEVIFQSIALVLLATGAALVELMYLGAPPEIIFLREDTLYPEKPAEGIAELGDATPTLLSFQAAQFPTVTKYCADNKCDIKDLTYVLYISEATAHEMYNAGESQFIDARNEADFASEHIPFALNIPVAAFGSGWPDEIKNLMKELQAVVYCEGMSCDASQLVAKHLIRYGFKNVKILETGFPGWKDAGFPTEGD